MNEWIALCLCCTRPTNEWRSTLESSSSRDWVDGNYSIWDYKWEMGNMKWNNDIDEDGKLACAKSLWFWAGGEWLSAFFLLL